MLVYKISWKNYKKYLPHELGYLRNDTDKLTWGKESAEASKRHLEIHTNLWYFDVKVFFRVCIEVREGI